MINEAIAKIKGQAGEDPVLQMMAQQISDHITTQARAGMVLAEGKTLEGCKKAFDSHANKNKKGSMAIIGPQEAEKLIYEYFGFDVERESSKVIDLGSLLDF